MENPALSGFLICRETGAAIVGYNSRPANQRANPATAFSAMVGGGRVAVPPHFLPSVLSTTNRAMFSPIANAAPLPVRRPAKRRHHAAFTLLELLLVLAILVVIGGIALVNFGGAQDQASVNATTTQLNSVKQAIQMYRIHMNTLPDSLDELKDGPSDSAKKAKWTGSIMTTIPTDAWGNDIAYTKKGNTYELRSAGLDGQANTDDDIIVTNE